MLNLGRHLSARLQTFTTDGKGSRSDPLPVRPNGAVTVAQFQEPRRADRLSMIQMYIRSSKTNRERFLDLGVWQEWLTAREQCADLESDSLARRATLNLRVAR